MMDLHNATDDVWLTCDLVQGQQKSHAQRSTVLLNVQRMERELQPHVNLTPLTNKIWESLRHYINPGSWAHNILRFLITAGTPLKFMLWNYRYISL